MNLDADLKNCVNNLRDMDLDASEGLDEDLFLLISSLIPVPNIDLLVTNDKLITNTIRRRDLSLMGMAKYHII